MGPSSEAEYVGKGEGIFVADYGCAGSGKSLSRHGDVSLRLLLGKRRVRAQHGASVLMTIMIIMLMTP